jgi:hypothetical protein
VAPCCQAGCALEPSIIPLLVHHLASSQQDTRSAAAAALADELRQHTSAIASTLGAVLALYGEDDEEEDEAAAAVLLDDAERAAREQARQVQAAARRGVAAGLEALAGVLGDGEVVAALDFLVARGLAEPDDAIRAAMVGAGGLRTCCAGRGYCSSEHALTPACSCSALDVLTQPVQLS